MNIRIIVFTLLCFFGLIGNIGCTSDSSSASSSTKTETSTSVKSKTSTPANLKTGWYPVVAKGTQGAVERIIDRGKETYYLEPQPIVTADHIREVDFYTGFNSKGVQMNLNEKGTALWAEATKKYIAKYVAFIFEDKLVTVQRVAAQDLLGATIFYKKEYSEEEMQAIMDKLTPAQK